MTWPPLSRATRAWRRVRAGPSPRLRLYSAQVPTGTLSSGRPTGVAGIPPPRIWALATPGRRRARARSRAVRRLLWLVWSCRFSPPRTRPGRGAVTLRRDRVIVPCRPRESEVSQPNRRRLQLKTGPRPHVIPANGSRASPPRLVGRSAGRVRHPQHRRAPAGAAVLGDPPGRRRRARLDGAHRSQPAAQAVSLRDLLRQGQAARPALPGRARGGPRQLGPRAQGAARVLGSVLRRPRGRGAPHVHLHRASSIAPSPTGRA